jgi:hypothetical protein
MKQLHDVKINMFDTCFSYALRRIGIFTPDLFYVTADEWLKDKVMTAPVTDISELSVGDLLYRYVDNDAFYVNREIIGGKLIEHKVHLCHHFMVYEGDGIISDATNTTDNVYHIRFRYFKCNDARKIIFP